MMMPRCGCRFIGKRSGNGKGPLSLEGAEIAANLLRPRAVHRYLRPDIKADIRTQVRARGDGRPAPFSSLSSIPNDCRHVICIELRFVFLPFGFLTRVNHGNAASLSKARFPIRAMTAACKIRNHEPGRQKPSSDFVID